MNDSMDEEFERGGGGGGGVSVATRSGTHVQAPPTNSLTAAPFALQAPVAVWARKRGRGAIGIHGQGAGEGAGGMQEVVHPHHNGGSAAVVVHGRESPDSDMSSGSSSSSEFSINRGIKRMRLDEQQQQERHHREQQQQQLQLQQPTSAFGPYASSANAGGRPSSQGWGVTGGGVSGRAASSIGHERNGSGHRRQDGRLLGGDGGGGLVPGRLPFAINNSAGSIIPQHDSCSSNSNSSNDASSAGAPARSSAEIAGNGRPHPPPPPLSLDRSMSGSRVFRPADPAILSRSCSGGLIHNLQQQQSRNSAAPGGSRLGAGGGALPFPTRSASFDTAFVPAFSPFAPQPPAQARYVRGIRVEANAPADVDYSNVNHALRQLHMERRLATERAAAEAAAAAGRGLGIGRPENGSVAGWRGVLGEQAGWPGMQRL